MLAFGINCIERRFDRIARRLKDDLTLFMPLNVSKNVIRGFLQPILRPAVLIHM